MRLKKDKELRTWSKLFFRTDDFAFRVYINGCYRRIKPYANLQK